MSIVNQLIRKFVLYIYLVCLLIAIVDTCHLVFLLVTFNDVFYHLSQNFCSREDTIFCGVFDGHGPYGHMVAKKVRDSLPLKLNAHWELNVSGEEVLKEISINTAGSMNSEDTAFISADEESRVSFDAEETEKLPEIFQTLKESFLKAFKVMDRDLKTHQTIDCFCSGTTAVTLIKQVLYQLVTFGKLVILSHLICVIKIVCKELFLTTEDCVSYRVVILLLETLVTLELCWVQEIKTILLLQFS